ncbi:hypothetical protein [Pyxidicoccus caerfyrddinensis]|uniref:hypothetical protein n=1 Tax=Pyxidicoccus caerfyrddinensis TaxID=2709663 RepID=UPI0013DD40C7|nr:hypothetical protein [Pyxidicoccus caerfyrddinensis]
MANPSNPLTVNSAMWGAADAPNGPTYADVTTTVQAAFNAQYNPLTLFFSILVDTSVLGPDPAVGTAKTLVVTYSIQGGQQQFARAQVDGGTLIIIFQPLSSVVVLKAYYATTTMGIDITDRLQQYIADPSNGVTLTVGDQGFFNYFTGCTDPAPNQLKTFYVSYQLAAGQAALQKLATDGQTLTLD